MNKLISDSWNDKPMDVVGELQKIKERLLHHEYNPQPGPLYMSSWQVIAMLECGYQLPSDMIVWITDGQEGIEKINQYVAEHDAEPNFVVG